MTLSEETLMAFADGELDDATRASVERAMREDPAVAARVARHQRLRQRLQGTYAGEIAEAIPERLLAAARGGKVVQLAQARAALARNTETLSHAAPAPVAPARLWWRPVGTLAASLLLGVGLGYSVFRQASPPLVSGPNGSLVAGGALRRALTEQLAATQPTGAAVQVGLSYLSHTGEYCRSFALKGDAAPAGIACHQGDRWRIEALSVPGPGPAGTYRTAATALPPALLKVIEDGIEGQALDAAGEVQAQRRGWQRTP